MSNPERHSCFTCGFTWKHGQDGSHSCAPILAKKVVELEASLKEREWASVDDRLPLDHGIFLAHAQSGMTATFTYNMDKGWGSLRSDDYEYWNSKITHWMPLPSPPEGEG